MEKDKYSIYRKMFNARGHIKKTDMKKEGYNEYSNYNYFTPEQVDQLVYTACEKEKLLTVFNLNKVEGELVGILKITDVENPESFLEYKMLSATPNIKATNELQQLGGAMTYTERYICMSAFGIKDNTIDPDSQNNKPKSNEPKDKKLKDISEDDKKWLNKFNKDKTPNEYYGKVLKRAKEKGTTIKDLQMVYKIHPSVIEELKKDGLK